MTDKEKDHEIKVVYNQIKTVAEDTDEGLWAKECLEQALACLEDWFEEPER